VNFNSNPVPTTLLQNQQNNTLIAQRSCVGDVTAGVGARDVTTADGYTTPPLNFTIQSTLKVAESEFLAVGSGQHALQLRPYCQWGYEPYQFAIVVGRCRRDCSYPPASSAAAPSAPLPRRRYQRNRRPPPVPFAFNVQVTDSGGNTTSGTFSITIAAQPPPQLLTSSLPSGVIGTPYTSTLTASGDEPYRFSVIAGALPPDCSILRRQSAAVPSVPSPRGVISGTPTATGTFAFACR